MFAKTFLAFLKRRFALDITRNDVKKKKEKHSKLIQFECREAELEAEEEEEKAKTLSEARASFVWKENNAAEQKFSK